MNMKSLLKRNEFYVAVIIIALAAVIQAKSGQFFAPNNLIDLARSVIVPGLLCLALMQVIISGNIDVSFPQICMLTMF